LGLPVLPAPIIEAEIVITSEPSGARILMNDQPVGRAPLHVTLPATARGFCRDYTTIRARFVAEDATQVSRTVETEITPREKVPARIIFSPLGVQRLMAPMSGAARP